MKLDYRPEIDGLRAVAVLAVVLYHAEFYIRGTDPFKGGFIGVDVFFVISGYLITSIIIREISRKEFSFSGFYERRARRILPALFTVMALSIPFAWLTMLPKAMKEYAGSLLSSLFFGSNIWFWQEDSYTAEPSALKPLLHTWSLSVEEQFYVLFPITLLLIWRFARKQALTILLIGFLISLQGAHYGSAAFPEAAFFLLPFRGWELFAGAFLAVLELERGRSHRGFPTALMPGLGLALIIASVFIFNNGTRHPSYITLLPVVGTMLIIRFARPGEVVTRVLGGRLIVGLGLVSYSFYLWHFPIFAFSRIRGDFVSNTDKLELIAAALLFSTISYFLIEKPARNVKLLGRRNFFAALIAVFLGLVIGGGLIFRFDGLPGRLGAHAGMFKAAEIEKLTQGGRICGRFSDEPCEFISADASSTLISVGDSQADAISGQLLKSARHNRANFVQLTRAACLLLEGVQRFDNDKRHEKCARATAFTHSYLAKISPATIVYSGRLPLQFSGQRFDNGEGGVELGPSPRLVVEERFAKQGLSAEDMMHRMIGGWLELGHSVVLVYPIPEVGWDLPERVARYLDDLPPESPGSAPLAEIDISTSYSVYRQRTQRAREILDAVGDHPGLLRVYPERIFCDDQTGRCLTHDAEHLFYADDNHLSPYGARLVVEEIEKVLAWDLAVE